jgi:hypothetical protein
MSNQFGIQETAEYFGMLHLELRDGGAMNMLTLMLYMFLTMFWLLHYNHLYIINKVIRSLHK